MRGMFWNSRGLLDLAKHKHVGDCVREHGLDFVAISEAGKCASGQMSSSTYQVVSTTHGIVYQLVEGLEESFLGY